MKIKAKIYPEHLDKILRGEKNIEYRQFESITLDDGERQPELPIVCINQLTAEKQDEIREKYRNIPWDESLPIHEIVLGKPIGGKDEK